MTIGRMLGIAGALGLTAALVGCGASREVEVSGQVNGLTASGSPIKLVFFDVSGEGEELEMTEVHDIQLEAPGAFDEKIPLEGDSVLVRAIEDADGDGACTEGERWAEDTHAIGENDSVDPFSLALAAGACPATP